MIQASVYNNAPYFLREDSTGKALLKSIDYALDVFFNACKQAYSNLWDIEQMPEWRLDELAWENSILWYDYKADIDTKRAWVQNADEIMGYIGTEKIIEKLIDAIYGTHEILLYPAFNGQLHEFMLAVSEPKGEYYRQWSNKILEQVIPLRCKFDGIGYINKENVNIADKKLIGDLKQRYAGTFATSEDVYGGIL